MTDEQWIAGGVSLGLIALIMAMLWVVLNKTLIAMPRKTKPLLELPTREPKQLESEPLTPTSPDDSYIGAAQGEAQAPPASAKEDSSAVPS